MTDQTIDRVVANGDDAARSAAGLPDSLHPTDSPATQVRQSTLNDGSVDGRLAARRRWPALVAGCLLGGAATAAFFVATNDSDEAGVVAATETAELSTVAVEQRDLVDEVTWSGVLDVGATASVPAPVSGVVTAVAPVDSLIARGDVVARVDDRPIVVLLGDVPVWRDLSTDVEGDDVAQLEANLVALGYDVDAEVTIDSEFDAVTEDMVERWQESLGLDATGEVATGDIVVLGGAARVVTTAVVGTTVQPGEALAAVEIPSWTFDVVGAELDDALPGVVDAAATPGTPVSHGSVLYTSDGIDVAAVIDPDPVTVALLDAMADEDIETLESILVFVGLDPDGAIEVNDETDLATGAALVRWQENVGLPATGSASRSDYVVVPSDRSYVVGTVVSGPGTPLGTGSLVMTLESPTLELRLDVAVDEVDEFEVGQSVSVEQLDGTTFGATVEQIGDVIQESTGDETPVVEVDLAVAVPPETYVSGTVAIVTEADRIDAATVVPTRALLTLREGGFAVEVVDDDGTTRLVGVELGTFDDGVVDVIDGGVAPGDLVVVPT